MQHAAAGEVPVLSFSLPFLHEVVLNIVPRQEKILQAGEDGFRSVCTTRDILARPLNVRTNSGLRAGVDDWEKGGELAAATRLIACTRM